MGTLDIVISRDRMLASPANYKLWRTTMEHVFEKEDLWDFFEPIASSISETSSSIGEALSGTTGASETTTTTTPSRQE